MKMECFCISSTTPAERVDREITREIEIKRKVYESTYRLLLLGAGESGKSTIVKQMKILHHDDGFDKELQSAPVHAFGILKTTERRAKILDIKLNLRDAIVAIAAAMPLLIPPIEIRTIETQSKIDFILKDSVDFNEEEDFTEEFYDAAQSLWLDSDVQACYKRRNEYQLIDCAKYFLDKVSVIRQKDYEPSNQDLLRCRVLTKGIFEIEFKMEGVRFHMFDVGGQREERRKWIQCFNEVTAIIFVVASSSYDMTLREDLNKNRLQEAIDLFYNIWNNRWLGSVSVILFLNKEDLLTEKILDGRSKLESYFPEYRNYTPPETRTFRPPENESYEVTRAKNFIKEKFRQIYITNPRDHTCYSHYTCAVDTQNIKRVFDGCQSIIRRWHLKLYDLM